MLDAGAGAHHLDIAFFNDGNIAHAVAVLQISFQGNADDLHVVVWMRAEAHPPVNGIVVQHPQCTEMHSLRIVVTSKAEGVETFQPAMVRLAAGISLVKHSL